MPLIVKENKTLYPGDIGLLGTIAVMLAKKGDATLLCFFEKRERYPFMFFGHPIGR